MPNWNASSEKSRKLAQDFSAAAGQYRSHAMVQQWALAELLQWLEILPCWQKETCQAISPPTLLDLGCGPAMLLRALSMPAYQDLRAKLHSWHIVQCDVAEAMCQEAALFAENLTDYYGNITTLQADACRLPVADESVDVVFSNVMLQWIEEVPLLCQEVKRVLKPGGIWLLSSFVDPSLIELRMAYDLLALPTSVHQMRGSLPIQDALKHAGFHIQEQHTGCQFQPIDSALSLMRQIKHLGARYKGAPTYQGLRGKHFLAAIESAYDSALQARKAQLEAEIKIALPDRFASWYVSFYYGVKQ